MAMIHNVQYIRSYTLCLMFEGVQLCVNVSISEYTRIQMMFNMCVLVVSMRVFRYVCMYVCTYFCMYVHYSVIKAQKVCHMKQQKKGKINNSHFHSRWDRKRTLPLYFPVLLENSLTITRCNWTDRLLCNCRFEEIRRAQAQVQAN